MAQDVIVILAAADMILLRRLIRGDCYYCNRNKGRMKNRLSCCCRFKK